MVKFLLGAMLLAAPAAFAKDNPLVGSWTLDGAAYSEVKADGTGTVRGEAVHWQAKLGFLAIQYASGNQELMMYAVKGDKLWLTMNNQTMVLTRGSGKAAKAGKTSKAAKTEGKIEKAAGSQDQLSALLLSSPWCSFTYNQISGASHTERVVFHQGGTWSSGARGESYSSGMYGTVAGQTDSANGGRWQVRGGALFLSAGGGELQDAGLSVTRNSNGYPILHSGKKEYSQCR
jgi:hypothetical protein